MPADEDVDGWTMGSRVAYCPTCCPSTDGNSQISATVSSNDEQSIQSSSFHSSPSVVAIDTDNQSTPILGPPSDRTLDGLIQFEIYCPFMREIR